MHRLIQAVQDGIAAYTKSWTSTPESVQVLKAHVARNVEASADGPYKVSANNIRKAEPMEQWHDDTAVKLSAETKGVHITQATGDIPQLYIEAQREKPLYDALLNELMAALAPLNTGGEAIKLSKANLKHIFRITEKTVFSTEHPLSAVGVLDIVRGMIVCESVRAMGQVMTALDKLAREKADQGVRIVRVKNRLRNPTNAGHLHSLSLTCRG